MMEGYTTTSVTVNGVTLDGTAILALLCVGSLLILLGLLLLLRWRPQTLVNNNEPSISTSPVVLDWGEPVELTPGVWQAELRFKNGLQQGYPGSHTVIEVSNGMSVDP